MVVGRPERYRISIENFPAAQNVVHEPVGITEELLPLAKRQHVHAVGVDLVPRIEVRATPECPRD
jgi:hypothetical protein